MQWLIYFKVIIIFHHLYNWDLFQQSLHWYYQVCWFTKSTTIKGKVVCHLLSDILFQVFNCRILKYWWINSFLKKLSKMKVLCFICILVLGECTIVLDIQIFSRKSIKNTLESYLIYIQVLNSYNTFPLHCNLSNFNLFHPNVNKLT